MYTPSVDELLRARVSPDVAAASDGMAFYRKRGCPRCNQTGYKGRIGIYQLLAMSEQLESLAVQKASREDLERAALAEGMRTLWDDGLAKVAAGLTSVEELARVSDLRSRRLRRLNFSDHLSVLAQRARTGKARPRCVTAQARPRRK